MTAREAAEKVVRAAKARGVTFVTAESCTGGLIGHLVTEVPGASEVYLGGWVAYADRRKVEDLGVHSSIIARHGAVSQQVVETMAQGARSRAKADFAVATTGIAGPAGGTADKPVGTLWVAVAGPDGVQAKRHQEEDAGRVENKQRFVTAALTMLQEAMGAG